MQCVHLPHVLALPSECMRILPAEGAFNDSFKTELLMFHLLRSPCHLRSPHKLYKDPLQLERAQCMEGIFLLQTLLMCSLIIELTPCVWLCVNLWNSPMTTLVLAEWLKCFCVWAAVCVFMPVSIRTGCACECEVDRFGSEQLWVSDRIKVPCSFFLICFVYAHLSLSLVGSVCLSE